MIEDKHLKRQFTVKDQVGSLEMGVENMTGRLDSNPNPSGDTSRKFPFFLTRRVLIVEKFFKAFTG
jgi:hypothetical protein